MQTTTMLSTGQTDHLPTQNLRNMEVQLQMRLKLQKLIRNMSRQMITILIKFLVTLEVSSSRFLCCLSYILQGYYRRGAAFLAMGKFKDALKDNGKVYTISLNHFTLVYKLVIDHINNWKEQSCYRINSSKETHTTPSRGSHKVYPCELN